MAGQFAAEQEAGCEVYGDDFVPFGGGEVLGCRSVLKSPAIDQDIDSVFVFDADSGDYREEIGTRGEVTSVDVAGAVEIFD